MMIPFRRDRFGLTWSERLADVREWVWHVREWVWLCEIRRIHRIKMQSYGYCIRCGRKVQ